MAEPGTGRTLRVGVVGAGNIATIAQLPTLLGRDDVEMSALVSRREDPSELVRRWSFRTVHRTAEEMLESDVPDAVFVLTPRGEHAAAVRAALRAGADVFCEKPLATTAAEAVELADLADESGRLLMVGFNRRFAPYYVRGREVFGSSGATFCVAQKNRAGSEYRATFENAIHMVDLLRWYCGGEAVEVTAHASAPDPWREDGVCALVRFDTGATGVLVAARNAGTWDERLEAYGAGTTVRVEAPERVEVTVDGITTTEQMRQAEFGWATATRSFGFAAAVEHFLDRVHDRAQPLTSGREAAATQLLLDRVLESAGLPVEEAPDAQWSSRARS